MSEKNNIDDLFSRGLDNFGVEPPEDLKKSIDDLRTDGDPDGDKNGKRFWPLMIILIAVFSAFAWLFYPSERKANIKRTNKSIAVVSDTAAPLSTINNNTNDLSNANSSIDKIKSLPDKVIGADNDNTKTKVVYRPTSSNTENTSRSSNHTTLKNNSITKANVSSQNEEISNKKNNRKKTASNEIINVERVIDVNKEKPSNLLEAIENNAKNTEDYATDKVKNPNRAADSSQVEMAIKDSIVSTAIEDSIPIGNNANKADTTSVQQKKKLNYFIEAGVGASYISQKLNYTNLKDSLSLKQPAISAQITVGLNYKNILVKLGFGIMQLKEQSNFMVTNQIERTVLVDSIVIVGTDTTVLHNVPVKITVNKNDKNTTLTSYGYFQIPLSVGYTIPFKKLSVEANAGIQLNLLYSSSGNYKSSINERVVAYSNKKDAPLNSFFTSYLLAVGVTYELNKHFKLLIQVPLSMAGKSMYKSDYFINRKISEISLKVKVRYTF